MPNKVLIIDGFAGDSVARSITYLIIHETHLEAKASVVDPYELTDIIASRRINDFIDHVFIVFTASDDERTKDLIRQCRNAGLETKVNELYSRLVGLSALFED